MQDSTDLRDESISSTIESTQECWLNSDPAHQNILKQQSSENDIKAQSESKLEGGTLSRSDNKPPGSMGTGDASLKQSELRDEAPSENKPLGSMESENDSLKLVGGDAKQSESDDALLKQSSVEAGESTAKKKQRNKFLNSLDKLVKKITPPKWKIKSKHDIVQTPDV